MTLLFYLHAITQGWWAARLWSNKENSSSLCPGSSHKSVALCDEEAAFQYNIFTRHHTNILSPVIKLDKKTLCWMINMRKTEPSECGQGSVKIGDNAWRIIVTRDALQVLAVHRSPSAIILWKIFPSDQTELMSQKWRELRKFLSYCLWLWEMTNVVSLSEGLDQYNSLFPKLPNYVEVHLSCQLVRVKCAVGWTTNCASIWTFYSNNMQKECLESSGFWYRIVRYGIATFRRNISLLSSWYRVQLVVRNSTWLINKITARNIAINLGLAWKPHARYTCVATRSAHLSTIRCKLVATFPPQSVSSPTSVAVLHTLDIVAACSRTLIILSSSPQLNHCNDWLKLPV